MERCNTIRPLKHCGACYTLGGCLFLDRAHRGRPGIRGPHQLDSVKSLLLNCSHNTPLFWPPSSSPSYSSSLLLYHSEGLTPASPSGLLIWSSLIIEWSASVPQTLLEGHELFTFNCPRMVQSLFRYGSSHA